MRWHDDSRVSLNILLRVRMSRKSGGTISGGVPSTFTSGVPTPGQVCLEFWR